MVALDLLTHCGMASTPVSFKKVVMLLCNSKLKSHYLGSKIRFWKDAVRNLWSAEPSVCFFSLEGLPVYEQTWSKRQDPENDLNSLPN